MPFLHVLNHYTHMALAFVVILSVIVFIHEFGHYIVAKLCGVKIEAFSIGFGQELFGFNDRSGTRWKFSVLPLGGYVKMFGDASEASTPSGDLDLLSEEEKRHTFHFKPLPQKAAIVAAGPAANFLLTIAVLTILLFTNGLPSTEPVIGEVMKDSPAAQAGLMAGDRVWKINGDKMHSFDDISQKTATNLGTPMTLVIERAGRFITFAVTPRMSPDKDMFGNPTKNMRPLLGLKSRNITYKDIGIARAFWEATKRTYDFCAMTMKAIGQMVTGKRSLKQISGPLGIAKMSGEAANQSFLTILGFVAMLSANLGLVNILPIPMLDGGHLAYYAIEAVRGRALSLRAQEMGFRVGMALLAMLMAFSIFNDLRNAF
jgi:regulator of sigma E protease